LIDFCIKNAYGIKSEKRQDLIVFLNYTDSPLDGLKTENTLSLNFFMKRLAKYSTDEML